MKIKTEEINNRQVIHVEGRIDSITAPDFEQKVSDYIKSSHAAVIIDFSSVDYISSAGLRALLVIAKKGQETQREIALCCMNENILDVIRITGFLTMFKTFSNLDSALKT